MKRVLFGIIIGLLAGAPLISVSRAAEETTVSSTGLIIKELYLGSPTDAADEYVLLYNASNSPIDMAGISVEYKAATGKSWYQKARMESGTLDPGSEHVLATVRERDTDMGSGMAQTGGNLRIVSAQAVTVDAVAWGNGDSAEGTATIAPKSGQALRRVQDDTGIYLDNGNNLADFEVVDIDVVPLEDISDGDVVSQTVQENNDDSSNTKFANIEITELLPDPASPSSDADDEYIELFNPNTENIYLNGWKLTDAAGHSAKLDGLVVGSNQYLAIYSAQSKLSLNNSGDVISLINPSGSVVMSTPDYGAAKEGLTFGVSADGWGWLSEPTPDRANAALATEEALSAASTKAKSKKATSSANKKKAKAAKTKKSKTPKLAKTANAQSVDGSTGITDEQAESVPWTWLVAGLGVLGVGYGVYEYRPEIISFIAKLRAKFSARS
jgi:hypothetical protein